MFIYKKNTNYKIKSILTSKVYIKRLQPLGKLNLFFIVKNKSKDQVLFLFIILNILISKSQTIYKKKNKQKNKFLGFRIFAPVAILYKFVLMHLSILDSIEYSKSKSNNGEAFITFKDFPIIYEIDRICETYNPLLDFISNYKFIVNAKILLCAKYN